MIVGASRVSAQQRPLVTEDPETIGSGLVLFEGGFDQQYEVSYPVSGLKGDLLRLPTLGLSFGLSSIAELQIDGGLYNRLNDHVASGRAALRSARLHRRQDERGRGHRRGDEDPAAVGDPGPPGVRRAVRDAPAERQQRERPRPRYDRLLRRRPARQDRPVDPLRRQRRSRHPRGPGARRSPERRARCTACPWRARCGRGSRSSARSTAGSIPATAIRRLDREPRRDAARRPVHAIDTVRIDGGLDRRHHLPRSQLRLHRRRSPGSSGGSPSRSAWPSAHPAACVSARTQRQILQVCL